MHIDINALTFFFTSTQIDAMEYRRSDRERVLKYTIGHYVVL